MAGATVIRAERLAKRYVIDGDRHADATLRDAIVARARSTVQMVGRANRPSQRVDLWALRDVSFSIDEGDVIGIVGRNGAGKSTLLKILSRITEPTSGRVGVKGRIGSLLEVGTGFHPELSGRENIYLYGSVLGMKRADIRARYDQIIAFAEIGRLLDTPIKRYSSGMQVRLAFAVAAHLEPEILIVDEVLAVGDVEFQKRCIARMSEVAREGRTVIFVSHNMALVQSLCERGILLERGVLTFDGSIRDTVARYLRELEQSMLTDLSDRTDRRGAGAVRLQRVELIAGADGSGAPMTGAHLSFGFVLSEQRKNTSCVFAIYDSLGNAVAEFHSSILSSHDSQGASPTRFVCTIDHLPLVTGRYRIDTAVYMGSGLQDAVEGAAVFDVEEGVFDGRPIDREWKRGRVAVPHRWITPPD